MTLLPAEWLALLFRLEQAGEARAAERLRAGLVARNAFSPAAERVAVEVPLPAGVEAAVERLP